MILLGSIERTELQAVFDWWLSPERRVFERGQSSPGQASKVSWESFTFVDEGSREDSRDKVKREEPQAIRRHTAFFLPGMTFFYLPQAAPVQEECNGPTASSKPQEPSVNHAGSGDLTFTPHSSHSLSPTHSATRRQTPPDLFHVVDHVLREVQAGYRQEDSAETLLLLHLLGPE